MRTKGGRTTLADLDELLAEIRPKIVPFDAARTCAAETAYARYGKGIHAAARLNLMEGAAYALTIGRGAPLLLRGDDIAATDMLIARVGSWATSPTARPSAGSSGCWYGCWRRRWWGSELSVDTNLR